MNITADHILNLIEQGEGISLEIKECKDSLPKSLWESYSAFANTRGGIILLGIKENKKASFIKRFEIQGVTDAYKLRTDFFNILGNKQKVSRSILVDSDVRTVEVNGKDVMYINVPEADYRKKPIYINDNLQDGTYKRTHEGDRHVDMEGLAMLIRDATDDIDSQIIEHYDMQDIDKESLRKYRQVFNDSNPEHSYRELSDKDFLIRLGGYAIDRHKEREGLTRAGLLMFGKGRSIHEVFPAFRVDYLDLIGINKGSSLKWNDRLTDDGRWEDNLYNFVSLVMSKLLFSVPSEGRLQGTVRVDGGLIHEGIREGFINCITYCDYMLNGVLRVDRCTNSIVFRNPGLLRINVNRIYGGDFTNARNCTIQKMFRMIGYGDNIGSGFQKILYAWKSLGYARPELKEFVDMKEVWLTLPLYKNDSNVGYQLTNEVLAVSEPESELERSPINKPKSEPINRPKNEPIKENEPINRPKNEPIKENEPINKPKNEPIKENEPINKPKNEPIKENEPINRPKNEPIKENEPITEFKSVEKLVYMAIKENPGIKKVGLMSITQRSNASVKRVLKKLGEMRLIEYRGSNKTGGYFPL